MFISGTILIYGRDLSLLETRSCMLQKAGFRVRTAMELAEAERILRSEKVSLSILCHTLSSEQRSKAIAKVEELGPQIKKLLLAASTFPSIDGDPKDIFYTSAGPGALVATVNRLASADEGTSNGVNLLH